MTQYKFGCNGITRYAYDVLFILEAKHGSRVGENLFQPLIKFVNIATTMHVKNMLTYNPGKVAHICEYGGSIDSVYMRLKRLTEKPGNGEAAC